jgi:hypothetical protein
MDTMNEYDIVFSLESPQNKNTGIEISMDTSDEENFLYKFLIGFQGRWNAISDFTPNKNVKWTPAEEGNYTVMAQMRRENSAKSFEFVSKAEYAIENIPEKINKELLLGSIFIDEVIIEKSGPFVKNETINIKVIASGRDDIKYSFIIRKDGKELKKIKYGSSNWVDFTPEMAGEFELEIRVRDKISDSEFDTNKIILMNVLDFLPAKIDYVILPLKKYYIVSDVVALETIVQNTCNVLLKYILKINDQVIEEAGYVEGTRYIFTPKCSGIYSVEILAKNINSKIPYDSKKEIRVRIYDSYPITNTKVSCDKDVVKSNEPVTFSVSHEGGSDVVYEFFIMEGGNWKLVQNFSKKNYYMFIPFTKGQYRVLALLKSQKNKISYEDYDIYSFNIEEEEIKSYVRKVMKYFGE